MLLTFPRAIWFWRITRGSVQDLEFEGNLFFDPDGWLTDETYSAKVRAVVEQQYLQKLEVPVPVRVQHMAIFYNLVAEPDQDVRKLPIRGYVQAKSGEYG